MGIVFSRGVRLAGALTAALVASGCTGLSTASYGEADRGLYYFLPTTRVPIVVAIDFDADRLIVEGQDIEFVPEDGQPLQLASVYSPTSQERVRLQTRNGLLSSIKYNSVGELDETIVAATKSFFALQAESSVSNLPNPADAHVAASFDTDFATLAAPQDVAWAPDEALTLNSRANAALRTALIETPVERLKSKRFLSIARTRALLGETLVVIRVTRPGAAAPAEASGPVDPEICKVGFCTRSPVPYTVETRFFDGSIHQATLSLPNGGPVHAVALDRGVFTDTDIDVEVTNGMVERFRVARSGSELEALAATPFDMVVGATAGLTANGALLQSRTSAANAEIDAINAEADLQRFRNASQGRAQAESFKQTRGRVAFSFAAGSPGAPAPEVVTDTVQGDASDQEETADAGTDPSPETDGPADDGGDDDFGEGVGGES